jgi:two-component system nitrogen regulation response regulator NtrX
MDATLLIADADAQRRDAFRRFFSQCGFRVATAADGLDCLAKLRAIEPDVLIAEADMPWGGAAGVVAMLQEDHDWSNVPAVMIVGSAPPEVLGERTGVPARSCFQQPVAIKRLLDRVCLAIAFGDPRRTDASGNHRGRERSVASNG